MMEDDDDSSTASPPPPPLPEEEKKDEMDVEMNENQSDDESSKEEEKAPPSPQPSPVASPSNNVNNNNNTSSNNTPRLVLTKLVLENFKSYGGIREIGPFHKCFSAVVGPNGSGKSNVIDALLFVFGKRAKKLRLNKVRELIHNSNNSNSGSKKPSHAKVSVYMQEIIDTGAGEEDYIVVPNTEVVISRTAKSDNSSSYQLQNRNAPFKEIAAFLKERGICLDNNRFLILQGEVEMISMMPPRGKTENDEGLLEYLEDIIGSSAFVHDTNEAAVQVEQLTEQRQEKLHRCKAVEKEKDSLQAAKLEAEALLQAERSIREQQNLYYQLQAWQADRQQQEHYEPQREKLQQELEAVREKLQTAHERICEMEKKNGGILREQQKEYELIHSQLQQTSDDFHQYQRRDAKLQEEIKHSKAALKKLETKVKTHEKQEQTAIAKEEKAVESIPQLEEQLEALTETKTKEDAKLEELLDDAKHVTVELRSELESKTQELAPIQQERAVFENALETAESQVELLTNATQQAQQQLQQAQTELDSLDAFKNDKEEAHQAATEELQVAQERLEAAKEEEKVLADKERKVNQRNKDLLARSEEAKAALQSKGAGRSAAVDGILKAARPGGELAKVGVLGRLGDLATISAEYDVAVSTACGMLDNIVVLTTAGAQKCLEFLRRHKLGRANFIPLDKMKKGAHDRVVETPENAPLLFRLITPKSSNVAPAVFLGVQHTLVAPDLETATRWAYDFGKRWRVVTLDGKLIETTGTMAGGGKSVKRGKMKLSNGRKNATSENNEDEQESLDCKQLEQEAAKAQELLQQIRGRRKELSKEIRQLEKRIKELDVQLPKLAMEIEGCDTTRQNLTKLIPELRSKSELSDEDQAKIEECQAKIASCKEEMASCVEQADKLEQEVARLQKAILDAGGQKLKNQQAACDKVLQKYNDTEKSLNSAKVAITSSTKAAAKAQKAKATTEQQAQECQATLEEKQEELKSLQEDAVAVSEAYEKVKALEAEKSKELGAANEECEALKKSLSDERCVEIELAAKMEGVTKHITDCENKKKHWAREIKKLVAAAKDEEEYLSDDEDDEDDDDESEEGDDDSSDGGGKPPAAEDADGDATMEDATDEATGPESNDMDTAKKSKSKRKKDKSALPTFSVAELEKYDKDEIKENITVLEMERNTIAKNANMGAIAEYRKKEADYLGRVSELDAVTEERNAARKHHEELRRKRFDMFMDGFGQITLKLKEMYQMITLGGDAELELVDSLDPFSEGIVFSVRPPKKSWKNISNLSGGEKTLSSLALVFALHHFKPTPLYVMDEIDAALDFKNVSIVANYIKERTKDAQFVIISLRNNMFELADRLVGIYKTNNCTNSVAINPLAFGVESRQNGHGHPTPALLNRTNNKNKSGKNSVSSAAKQSVRRLSIRSEQESQDESVVGAA